MTIDVNEFTSNSDGLNLILPNQIERGAVTINPLNQMKAMVEIQDTDENTLISFEDDFYIGESTFSFESQKYDGAVKFKIDKAPINMKGGKRETTMTLDFQVWEDQNLLMLKYFDQVYKLYKNLSKSEGFYIKIYVEGHEIFKSKNELKDEIFEGITTILHYTHHCRQLCKILKRDVCFDNSVYFTSEEHQQVYETIQKYENVILTDEFTSELTVQSEKFEPLEIFNSEVFTLERGEEITIDNVFNQKISMIIFVQHIFSKVKTTTIYNGKNTLHSYNLKLDNADRSGSYTRTTSFSPRGNTLNHT
ncbi:hypothetical protein [Acinetobacter wuhouensis]|uniref:hypothetical protein n=1 Tax=Acinetobacter wuhouensis TaxID=1879050 RepID=UPI00083B7C9D|nr:hypothetical protein [Acinetobacter wuhouensis]